MMIILKIITKIEFVCIIISFNMNVQLSNKKHCWPSSTDSILTALLCWQGAEGALLRLHGAGGEAHGPHAQVLLPRWCQASCSPIVSCDVQTVPILK